MRSAAPTGPTPTPSWLPLGRPHVGTRLLDALLPRPCPFCTRPVQRLPICAPCRDWLMWAHHDARAAQVRDSDAAMCGPPAVWAAAAYVDPLAQVLRNLKFHQRPDLAAPLGWWLASLLAQHPARADWEVVVPMPLSLRRWAGRGYNQALCIAQAVCDHLPDAPPLRPDGLLRCADRTAQSRLGRQARLNNVEGALVARSVIADRHVLLLDDVCTTGATLSVACAALHAAGARAITPVVVARSLSPPPGP